MSRPIIARLHSESHDSDGITVARDHQRLLQQNLHEAADRECPLSGRDRMISGQDMLNASSSHFAPDGSQVSSPLDWLSFCNPRYSNRIAACLRASDNACCKSRPAASLPTAKAIGIPPSPCSALHNYRHHARAGGPGGSASSGARRSRCVLGRAASRPPINVRDGYAGSL